MKYQLLLIILILVSTGVYCNKISDVVAGGVIGGGFVTLAGVRIYAKTKLNSDNDEYYNGEKHVDDRERFKD